MKIFKIINPTGISEEDFKKFLSYLWIIHYEKNLLIEE